MGFEEVRKPTWLRIRPPEKNAFTKMKTPLRKYKLNTVCEEAHCPNMSECWSKGTATFMILGETCTRACRFCAVKTGNPKKFVDINEPKNIAEAVKEMHLDYVVLTSVCRDDLEDQGASHFSECIKEIKKLSNDIFVEVLIPDFSNNKEFLKKVIDANPDVIAHNIETVKSMQKEVRDRRFNYENSLSALRYVKELNPKIYTKSSIMVGLGETEFEVMDAMKDLRRIDVDFLTIGQYLRPSDWHLKIKEFIAPEKFDDYKRAGLELGFLYVASGPFVRSSYNAGEFFIKNIFRRAVC